MFIRYPYLFKRVTIVGVGLMGGSLGLAIKKHKLAKEIVGLSYQQLSLSEAIKHKAIDIALSDIPQAVNQSDLIILATPVEAIKKLFEKINPHLKRGCILTDLGSVKSEIVQAAQKYLSYPQFFVGSHPLTGSEKKGVHNARAELFEGMTCIMTPVKETHKSASDRMRQLWTKIGAKVKFLTPLEHDQILSYVSHLPHLVAYGLIDVIPKSYLEFSAQGLKDTTRVAGSSAIMWNDICLSNSKNILKCLDEMVSNLALLRKYIVNQDNKNLLAYLERARAKREELNTLGNIVDEHRNPLRHDSKERP